MDARLLWSSLLTLSVCCGACVFAGKCVRQHDTTAIMLVTLGMLTVRLLVGGISSLCAGFVAAWITNRSVLVIKSLAGVLVVMFLPVITLGERFPPWYHVIFLVSLAVVTLFGWSLYPHPRR
jgi:hypothetical protein